MSDLQFRDEADYWQKHARALEFERNALRARVAELEAQWAGVPWKDIQAARDMVDTMSRLPKQAIAWAGVAARLQDWLDTHAPQEDT